MAAITVPRNTKTRGIRRRHVGITVAAGQTLYHGCIGGLDANTEAHAPGSGTYSLGRVCCPNGVSATAGEKVDLEEGSFSWDLDAGESLPAIGDLVYVKTNHEVSVNSGEGQAFATYEGEFDPGDGTPIPFFLSQYGSRVDAT